MMRAVRVARILSPAAAPGFAEDEGHGIVAAVPRLSPMKLALIGYGKMGRLVEEVARQQGLEVVDRFTGGRPLRAGKTARALEQVDALIDFSVPEAVCDTVRAAAGLGLHVAIGTTGWHHRLDEVRQTAESAGIGVVYGSNFSLGTNLFYRVVERAAELFSAFESYDPFLQESHHKLKKDSPSGTALRLGKILERHYGERQLPITSLRAGHIPGTHAVGFDSAADTVCLEHRARSRQGFAEGALLAAKWIAGRRGFYEFQQVLDDLYPA